MRENSRGRSRVSSGDDEHLQRQLIVQCKLWSYGGVCGFCETETSSVKREAPLTVGCPVSGVAPMSGVSLP